MLNPRQYLHVLVSRDHSFLLDRAEIANSCVSLISCRKPVRASRAGHRRTDRPRTAVTPLYLWRGEKKNRVNMPRLAAAAVGNPIVIGEA